MLEIALSLFQSGEDATIILQRQGFGSATKIKVSHFLAVLQLTPGMSQILTVKVKVHIYLGV